MIDNINPFSKNIDIDVSIIIPVFNDAGTIANVIKKLCLENKLNIEIIVINDGSTDGTLDVVSSFHDERVIIINQNNSGVYAARNAGLDAHRGKWLMFLDADDDVSEGFIYERYQLAEQHDVDVLVRNAWRKWSGGGNIRSVHCKQPYDRVLSGQAWLKHCVKNKEWPHYLWLQVVRSEYI